MKLYLASYKLSGDGEGLKKLLGGQTRACIIMNAQDYKDAATRQERLQQEIDLLATLGITGEELDLRDYFHSEPGLEDKLKSLDLIWVRGGNVFMLRKAFAQSGADKILTELINDEKIVYGGYSAGVCVLAPTLRGVELVDDEHVTAEGYQAETIWEGLGLLPFSVAPHYKSDHPESADVDKYVTYLEKEKLPYETLTDDESVVIGA